QSVSDAFTDAFLVLPAAMIGNAQGGQPEARGSDAGDVARIGASGMAAVLDEAGEGIHLVPKELKASALQALEKGILFPRKAVFGWVDATEQGGKRLCFRWRYSR